MLRLFGHYISKTFLLLGVLEAFALAARKFDDIRLRLVTRSSFEDHEQRNWPVFA